MVGRMNHVKHDAPLFQSVAVDREGLRICITKLIAEPCGEQMWTLPGLDVEKRPPIASSPPLRATGSPELFEAPIHPGSRQKVEQLDPRLLVGGEFLKGGPMALKGTLIQQAERGFRCRELVGSEEVIHNLVEIPSHYADVLRGVLAFQVLQGADLVLVPINKEKPSEELPFEAHDLAGTPTPGWRTFRLRTGKAVDVVAVLCKALEEVAVPGDQARLPGCPQGGL